MNRASRTSTTFQMYCNCEISMVRAINLHSFPHCLNHRASVVDNSRHVNNLSSGSRGNRGISTVVSTTCTRNWGNTSNTHDLHLWNLHDMHKQDVGHIVNELQLLNLNGHLNNDIMGICLCAKTGMPTSSSTNCNCGASTVFCATAPPQEPGIATIFSISCNCGISTTSTTSI